MYKCKKMTFTNMDFDFTFASEMNQMNRMMRCIGIWLLAGWGFISSIQGQDSAYLNMEARIENDTVVLEVRTIRFQDMIGTQFGVKFPSSNLSFIRGVAHPSLQGASVAGNPGNCLFSWMSPPQNPVSLADFTLLVEFRFHIDQPASEYCFEFGVPGFELRLRSVSLDPHPARGIALCRSSLQGTVRGLARLDKDGDCQVDSASAPVPFQVLRFSQTGGGRDYYAYTDETGRFSLELPTGNYEYSFLSNGAREFCNNPASLQVSAPGQLIEIVQSVKNIVDCAELEVNLTTPGLRWCDDVVFDLNYRNLGTSDAIDAFIELALDPALVWKSSGRTPVPLGNNRFRFDLGTLVPGQTGGFSVVATAPCSAEFMGSTLCTEARISPDAPCIVSPSYSGAELEITPACDQNEVVFQVKNKGLGDMRAELAFTTVEDDVMPGIGGGVLLLKNETREIRLPANGKTWRIVFDTIPDHPYQVRPTAALEGCGTGSTSKGFFNNYSLGDEAPQLSVACGELRDSLPNRSAAPEGSGPNHLVFRDNRLHHTIRIRNDEGENAFLLRVKESISEYLDPSSLQVTIPDHTAKWFLNSDGQIEISLEGVNLPMGSELYISYSARPRSDAPAGALLQHEAEYSFNFGSWKKLEPYFHTLGSWLISSVEESGDSGIRVEVFPNPFATAIHFQSEPSGTQNFQVEIYDPSGIRIFEEKTQAGSLIWKPSNPEAGLYFYQILSQGRMVQNGKLIRR